MRKFKRRHLVKLLGEEICGICNLRTEWNGRSLVLPVDHIDGNRNNNDPSNLRYLCPNCHSQTETFAGRANRKPTATYTCKCGQEFISRVDGPKKRVYCSQQCSGRYITNRVGPAPKIKWPTTTDVADMVSAYGYSETGRRLGVSDVAIRKHLSKGRAEATKNAAEAFEQAATA